MARSARDSGAARAPVEPELLERRAHLVVTQVEDVLSLGQEPVPGEQRAELANLVPEDRQVAVVDVEVVVLDVRKDEPGECKALVEGAATVLVDQRAILFRNPLTLCERGVARTRNVLAGLEAGDVGADRLDREPGVVDPGAVVVMKHAGSAREVEPRVLRLLELREPPLAGTVGGKEGHQLVFAARPPDPTAHAELDREPGEPSKLVVRAQDERVDARHHRRDRLILDLGEGLATALVEDEVSAVAEAEELEVILQDTVDPFEQRVVGTQELVARPQAAAAGDERLVFVLPELGYVECNQLGGGGLDPLLPVFVQLVPVLVVVAAPSGEELRPTRQGLLVGNRVRAVVDVAAEHAVLDPERRHDEQARARLVDRDDPRVEHDRVERIDRLRRMQPFVEPEAALLEGAPLLAEKDVVGVHLLPAVAARRDPHLEWARERPPLGPAGDLHRPSSSGYRSLSDSSPLDATGGEDDPSPPVGRIYGWPAAPAAS